MFLKAIIGNIKRISSSPTETRGVGKVISFPPIFYKFQSLPIPTKCFYESVKTHLGVS